MLSANTILQPIASTPLDHISSSILKVLLYFKVFNYPIRKEELFTFVCDDNKINIQAALAKMVNEGMVQIKDDFVWVVNHESIVAKRLEANELAAKGLKKAKKQARLLSMLPFIKCICISGSLSKYYMDKDSDIDYFIIVDENRLWITRFIFSGIIKSLKLLRKERSFCPNYIITGNNLEIRNKNIYTAMEVVTLLPVYNKESYEAFLAANEWVRSYFPHYENNISGKIFPYRKTLLKRIFNTRLFSVADRASFHLFYKRIKNQVATGKLQVNDDDIIIAPNEYKYHIKDHKNAILQQYSKNIADFSRSFGVSLHHFEAIW